MENPSDAAMSDLYGDTSEGESIDDLSEPVDAFSAMLEIDPVGATALRDDWGGEFDRNIALARRAATIFADPPLRAALEEFGLGDDPRIVRAAAEIGRILQQRSPVQFGDLRSTSGDLDARLRELTRRDDYWSPQIQREIRQIYLELYGDRPLPIHRGTGDAGQGTW